MLSLLKYLPAVLDAVLVISKLIEMIKEKISLQEKKAQAIAKNQQTSVEDKGLAKVDEGLKAQQGKLIKLIHDFLPKDLAEKASVDELNKLIEKMTILVNLILEIIELVVALTKK